MTANGFGIDAILKILNKSAQMYKLILMCVLGFSMIECNNNKVTTINLEDK